jgi:hypothetical protein
MHFGRGFQLEINLQQNNRTLQKGEMGKDRISRVRVGPGTEFFLSLASHMYIYVKTTNINIQKMSILGGFTKQDFSHNVCKTEILFAMTQSVHALGLDCSGLLNIYLKQLGSAITQR